MPMYGSQYIGKVDCCLARGSNGHRIFSRHPDIQDRTGAKYPSSEKIDSSLRPHGVQMARIEPRSGERKHLQSSNFA